MEIREEILEDLVEGTEHLDDGDLRAAEAALARMEKTAPGDTDVVAFAGHVAAAQGDIEAALTAYRRAWEIDPDNARPYLYAAEVQLYSRDRPEEAIELLDRALDITEIEEELIDGVLLKAEALVTLGDRDDEVRETLAELEGCDLAEPALYTRVGDLYMTIGDAGRAETFYREALEEDDHAEAWLGLGLVCDARDDFKGMVAAWLEVRRLDLEAERPPWHVSEAEFEKIAEAALAELPREVIDRLANVPILVEDVPSEELIRDGIEPRLLGLFSGVPLPHKSTEGQSPEIDMVHLFQRNIERIAQTRDEVAEEIRITVLHETAHFFGLEDEDLHRLGLG